MSMTPSCSMYSTYAFGCVSCDEDCDGSGERGREGQAYVWVHPDKLHHGTVHGTSEAGKQILKDVVGVSAQHGQGLLKGCQRAAVAQLDDVLARDGLAAGFKERSGLLALDGWCAERKREKGKNGREAHVGLESRIYEEDESEEVALPVL